MKIIFPHFFSSISVQTGELSYTIRDHITAADYNRNMGRFTLFAQKFFDKTDEMEYNLNKLVPASHK